MINILKISQPTSPHSNDGFPLVPLVVNVVQRCTDILKWHVKNTKNKSMRDRIKKLFKAQAVFDNVCHCIFSANVYQTFNELVYHMIVHFVYSWRFGFKATDI